MQERKPSMKFDRKPAIWGCHKYPLAADTPKLTDKCNLVSSVPHMFKDSAGMAVIKGIVREGKITAVSLFELQSRIFTLEAQRIIYADSGDLRFVRVPSDEIV